MPASWLTPELIRRLETLELSVRWVRAGHRLGGQYTINRRGTSIEFADYAPYTAGDDIRSIDWNLYARLDRLFVKTYREEVALSVELIIDATASMGLPTPEKFARANRLAVCLGYVGLTDHHHVRLSWIAPGPVASTPWFHQRSDRLRMVEMADAAGIGGRVGFSEWVRRAVAALRLHGGQAIVITDGMVEPADLFRGLHLLLVRNLEVKLIQVLSVEELHPARLLRGGLLVDVETGRTHQLAYRPSELEGAMREHNELLVRFCKRQGIAFAQHRLDDPLEEFVTKTLPSRGFLE